MTIWSGWSQIGKDYFMLGRYSDGFEAFVSGRSGRRDDWAWRVDCRLPPTFDAEGIVIGQASTRRDAMIAAQDTIAVRRLEDGISDARRRNRMPASATLESAGKR
jgi:hypothetical protein